MPALAADLSGQTALVTGGASGIGLATVELFARNGATVALNHLPNDPAGQQQVDRLKAEGLQVISAPGDVSKPGEAEAMTEAAIGQLGRLDYLVNNAGTSLTRDPIPHGEFDRMTEDFWSTILSTNLVGPFRCAKAAERALRDAKGAICNTASVAAFGGGSSIAYSASKAGLVSLTRNLARVLAPDVRVNAVAPGLVDSPWTKPWPDEKKKAIVENIWLGRMCRPDEIAAGIFFLCVGATYVTGQTLLVDGGGRA